MNTRIIFRPRPRTWHNVSLETRHIESGIDLSLWAADFITDGRAFAKGNIITDEGGNTIWSPNMPQRLFIDDKAWFLADFEAGTCEAEALEIFDEYFHRAAIVTAPPNAWDYELAGNVMVPRESPFWELFP